MRMVGRTSAETADAVTEPVWSSVSVEVSVTVAPVIDERTLTVTVKLPVAPAATEAIVHVTVPLLPTPGLVGEPVAEAYVVPVGSGVEICTFVSAMVDGLL